MEWAAQVNDATGGCITEKTGVLDTIVSPMTPRDSAQGPVALHSYTVFLPGEGVYDLTFFGKRKDATVDAEFFQHAMCLQYKLHAQARANRAPMPPMHGTRIHAYVHIPRLCTRCPAP